MPSPDKVPLRFGEVKTEADKLPGGSRLRLWLRIAAVVLVVLVAFDAALQAIPGTTATHGGSSSSLSGSPPPSLCC